MEPHHKIADSCDCWMTLRQASEYLAVSTNFVRKHVRLSKLPFARVGGKLLRFRKCDLDAWLESNGCNGEVGRRKN